MRKITREELVIALRSGEYTQTRLKMYDPETGGHCCLGVAGRLIGLDDKRLIEIGSKNIAFHDEFKFFPFNINEVVDLACRNDGVAGYTKNSFEDIANYIEQMPI